MKKLIKKQTGKVKIQALNISLILTLLLSKEIIEIVFTWLVLTGSPKRLAKNKLIIVPISLNNPLTLSKSSALFPIFSTIFFPPK